MVESDAQTSSESSQKSSCPSVMKRMYLSPGLVSAASALAAALIAYIAGDSHFLPVVTRSVAPGHARSSYFALMVDALLSAGAMSSASVPFDERTHPTAVIGRIASKDGRESETHLRVQLRSHGSTAFLSLDHDVSAVSEQTAVLELRQWNMLA